MLSPVMLIFIGLARVNCDMVPLGDDSNYTLGHSDRLVRLDGAICAHPVSPQVQPLQSVTLQADKMAETLSSAYFSIDSFSLDDVPDADVLEFSIPIRHSFLEPSGVKCCTMLDFEDFDPGGSYPCFEAYYTMGQVPGPHSSATTRYDDFLDRFSPPFCNLTHDPGKCLHFQSSECTIVGAVPEPFDAEFGITRSLKTLGMLLPPLFFVVEVANVLFSLIFGLFSMISPPLVLGCIQLERRFFLRSTTTPQSSRRLSVWFPAFSPPAFRRYRLLRRSRRTDLWEQFTCKSHPFAIISRRRFTSPHFLRLYRRSALLVLSSHYTSHPHRSKM